MNAVVIHNLTDIPQELTYREYGCGIPEEPSWIYNFLHVV